jgi:hypothetical protein
MASLPQQSAPGCAGTGVSTVPESSSFAFIAAPEKNEDGAAMQRHDGTLNLINYLRVLVWRAIDYDAGR